MKSSTTGSGLLRARRRSASSSTADRELEELDELTATVTISDHSLRGQQPDGAAFEGMPREKSPARSKKPRTMARERLVPLGPRWRQPRGSGRVSPCLQRPVLLVFMTPSSNSESHRHLGGLALANISRNQRLEVT
jgi:hypothetical protein